MYEILNGDALDYLDTIEPASIDVTITSPPYNNGTQYNRHQDRQPEADYLAWTSRWVAKVAAATKRDGSFFLNLGGTPSDPGFPFRVLPTVLQHFQLQNVIHWITSLHVEWKEQDAGGVLREKRKTFGHYKPINSRRYMNDCHEYIFHLTHTKNVSLDRLAIGVPYEDPSNQERWSAAGQGLHCRGNTWFIPYPTIQRRNRDRPHPATFPLELPKRCIRLHGVETGRWVLDPFSGLGTTAVAALELGMNFKGSEMDEVYYQIMQERLHNLEHLQEGTDARGNQG